jgi:hypothetical protein
MRAPRVSIAALMALVLISGIGLAALSRPSQLAAAFVFSVATVLLTVAILGAIHARGTARAFWSGFAIGGWMYLFLQYGPYCEAQIGAHTLPSAALDLLYAVLAPPQPQTGATWSAGNSTVHMGPGRDMRGMMGGGGMGGGGNNSSGPAAQGLWATYTTPVWGGAVWNGPQAQPTFFRIGHSLLSMLAGLGAGLLARSWAGRAQEAQNAANRS